MRTNSPDCASLGEVTIVPEVIEYINRRDCDFRICTSCGGPILLPTRVKPPKKTDLLLKAGDHTVYVSVHQARFLHTIHLEMIPFFDDNEIVRYER
ncbi:MAG: hypothetical protein ABSB80_08145 [Methanoregula sp.]|jgi:hypothetical protein|uniref:hypothetical protein n=1 Tax=Methanoregula sp. TaxID=2052170 RepID=UPI003D0D6803